MFIAYISYEINAIYIFVMDILCRVCVSVSEFFKYVLCCFSYLYPDGRNLNPDLSWVVQATPEDHIKVISVCNHTGSHNYILVLKYEKPALVSCA